MQFKTDLRAIGLSADEARLLIEATQAVMPLAREYLSDRQLRDEEAAYKALQDKVHGGLITRDQMNEIFAATKLSTLDCDSFAPSSFREAVREDSGVFSEHPSFGSVSRCAGTSNNPRVFGTPNTSRSVVSIQFNRAQVTRLNVGETLGEPYLRDGAMMFELELSTDQFAHLLRDRHSMSPCAISHIGCRYYDVPPRMLASFDSATEIVDQVQVICMPIYAALGALKTFMKREKISTKADYSELVQLSANVQTALLEAREPIRSALRSASSAAASAATKQLMVDIADSAKALGMDINKVISRMI